MQARLAAWMPCVAAGAAAACSEEEGASETAAPDAGGSAAAGGGAGVGDYDTDPRPAAPALGADECMP